MTTPTLHLSAIKNRIQYGHHLRPVRDWFILLSVFSLLLLMSVLWNVLRFSNVTSGQPLNAPATAATVTEKTEKPIRTLFDARNAEKMRYEREYRFVDPSL